VSIPTVEGRRFSVGKYDIIATPIPHSAQMLRYTVYVAGKRIGATVSQPTESDCLFLENPPAVPPLKIFAMAWRPGRPKKDAVPRVQEPAAPPHEELPHGMDLPQRAEER
jgi:hypothetical protein